LIIPYQQELFSLISGKVIEELRENFIERGEKEILIPIA